MLITITHITLRYEIIDAVEKEKGTSPILGLAADCLSGSSNSPSFVNTLADEGHRF